VQILDEVRRWQEFDQARPPPCPHRPPREPRPRRPPRGPRQGAPLIPYAVSLLIPYAVSLLIPCVVSLLRESFAPLSRRGANAPRWPQVDLAHLLALLEKARPSSFFLHTLHFLVASHAPDTPRCPSLRFHSAPAHMSLGAAPKVPVRAGRAVGPPHDALHRGAAGVKRARGRQVREPSSSIAAMVHFRAQVQPARRWRPPHPQSTEREREGGREGKRKKRETDMRAAGEQDADSRSKEVDAVVRRLRELRRG